MATTMRRKDGSRTVVVEVGVVGVVWSEGGCGTESGAAEGVVGGTRGAATGVSLQW